jgi:tyrosinase
MTDPDTAALDSIFWLHHANIDRLWATWLVDTGANPSTRPWHCRSFRLRDATGSSVRMRVQEVAAMPSRRRPRPVAAANDPVAVDRRGGSARIDATALPNRRPPRPCVSRGSP